MGWRGAVRSATAASKRADRARQKVVNAGNRQLEKIDRSATLVLEKARRLEALLEKDIIKALNLRFEEGVGFHSDPFQIQAGIFNGSISLTPDNKSENIFEPAAFEIGEARVEAFGMVVTPWATVVALKIESEAPDYRVKLNWVKKTNRSESKIVLVDDANDQYYYPISTDLGGEVFPGIPKTGLIAFEPFRKPTHEVQLRISGARFTTEKFEPELVYRYQPDSLATDIAETLAKPELPNQITEILQSAVNREQQRVQEQVKKATSSGCLVMLALPPALFLFWAFLRVMA